MLTVAVEKKEEKLCWRNDKDMLEEQDLYLSFIMDTNFQRGKMKGRCRWKLRVGKVV